MSESAAPSVLVEKRPDGVALITLNRPESLNAMGGDLLPRLIEALADCATDRAVRCVALTGAGRGFCAGGDVKGMAARSGGGSGRPSTVDAGAYALAQSVLGTSGILHAMPKPTVALINGAAAGGGLSLALACDVRIASEQAVLTTAFAKVGLSGDYGMTYFLPRIVGHAVARRLLFSAERVRAPEALALGLVARVVPPDALLAEGLAYCAELASGPTAALGRMKANLLTGETGTFAETVTREATHLVVSFQDHDHKEAARAFVEKREPRFEGY